MIKFKIGFVVILITLLAGCAKQAVDHHRYFLPATETSSQRANQSSALLQISSVQLAEFLNDGGLVLQLDDITLNQAKQHQWAEDLRQQINRGLQDRLNERQQQFTVVGPQTSAALRLSLVIDAFHGRHDGQALTSGQWQIQNSEGDIDSLQRFQLQTALAEPGYPALVRALGHNLDQLADMLAKALVNS